MFRPDSVWQWALLAVVLVELAIVLGLEGWALYAFESGLDWHAIDLGTGAPTNPDNKDDFGKVITNYIPYSRSLPTFLALFIFGMIYLFGLCWDALRLKNTIQVIGICVFNWILCLYGILQETQIADTIVHVSPVLKQGDVDGTMALTGDQLEDKMKDTTIAVPIVIGVASAVVSFIGWKLYHEFAWSIYKHVSADLKLRKRYMIFEIYIAILKFDFFFFLAFTMEFLVLLSGNLHDAEFYITIVALPITILILIAAAEIVRRENKPLQYVIMGFYLVGLAYFIFKLARIWGQDQVIRETYAPAARPLTVLAVVSVVMLALTFGVGVKCMLNFGLGLRPFVIRKRQGDATKANPSLQLGNMANPNLPTTKNQEHYQDRMVIE